MKIDSVMILAAGRGTRMRELTNECPKPLIKVAGRTLIDRIADKVVAFGFKKCVVNTCYLGEMIEDDLNARTDISFIVSRESEALETGGGVKNALHLLEGDTFFVINSDPCWTDTNIPALTKLANTFDPEKMDILLMLEPLNKVFGHKGTGDFHLQSDGTIKRKAANEEAPFVYAGAQILSRKIFENSPDGKFSLNVLYDQAQKSGRLYGMPYDGNWYHVGTPEALELANQAFSK